MLLVVPSTPSINVATYFPTMPVEKDTFVAAAAKEETANP